MEVEHDHGRRAVIALARREERSPHATEAFSLYELEVHRQEVTSEG